MAAVAGFTHFGQKRHATIPARAGEPTTAGWQLLVVLLCLLDFASCSVDFVGGNSGAVAIADACDVVSVTCTKFKFKFCDFSAKIAADVNDERHGIKTGL